MIDQLVEHCTAIKVTAGYVHGVTCINYISLYCMTDSPTIYFVQCSKEASRGLMAVCIQELMMSSK